MFIRAKIFIEELNSICLLFFNLKDPSPLVKMLIVSIFMITGWFYAYHLEVYDNLKGALAGAFIGAAVSALCSFLTSDKILSRDELTKIVDEALTSPRNNKSRINLEELKKFKHYYYHTSDARGPFWMYLKLENYKLLTPYLASLSVNIPKGHNLHIYNLEVFISEPNLIIKAKSDDGNEKTALHVFFDYCIRLESEDEGYYGFVSHLNWNRKDRLNPALLLENKIEGTTVSGRQPDFISKKLFKRWTLIADNSFDDLKKLVSEHYAEENNETKDVLPDG